MHYETIDAPFSFALKDLEIEEELKICLEPLLSERKAHHTELAMIQSEWSLRAQANGKIAADQWLYSQTSLTARANYLSKLIQDIDAAVESKRKEAETMKQKIAEEIGKAETYIASLLKNVPTIKVSYIEPKRNKRRMHGFRHLSSFRALEESIREIFPQFKYELTWKDNVLDSEDALIIIIEEHLKNWQKDDDVSRSTLVLELELLEEKGNDEEDLYASEDASSSSHDESNEALVPQSGKWSKAEKIRLKEGLRKFKSDYKSVSKAVGTRTNKQISNFLKKHPNFHFKKQRRSTLLHSEDHTKIAKWLDNSSIVANRITNNEINHQERFFNADDFES